MKSQLNSFFLNIILVPLIFLIVATLTMKDYGINWDEPFHFQRGHAYLHYYLTGKTNFLDLPAYPELKGDSDFANLNGESEAYDKAIKSQSDKSSTQRRSYFQSDVYSFEHFIKNDEGHPPASDILSSFFNYILYQKLGVMGDLESHHFYELFVSALLVGAVFWITRKELGLFPGLVAAFSLFSYPLFFSESHFNIKDPVETSFYGLTLIFLYFGVKTINWKYITASAVFAGLALGTKFNIFFAALIVAPWLIYHLVLNVHSFKKFKFDKKLVKKFGFFAISILLFLPICFGIFYALWPFLWADPLAHFVKILGFYKQIGTGTPGEMTAYIYNGWNTYPIIWIIYTTPIPVLVLSIIGFFTAIYIGVKKKSSFAFLVLLWFAISILRGSYPKAGIYGGVRQIMEYIPAMTILAGYGCYFSINTLNKYKKIVIVLISLGLAFTLYEMVKIHPNQNVYFNQLIGGLKGARDKNIPYWGNTYGNVYLQGVNWLNENAEADARLGLPIANMINVPRLKLRQDIDFSNAHWSGLKRQGEYEMEMDFEWPPKYWYSFQYYDKYLDPVFVVEVDGVPLLKLWKNDLAHTKKDFREEVIYKPASLVFRKNLINRELWIDMGREVFLTGVKIKHSSLGCLEQKAGYMAVSLDNKVWVKEPDPIAGPQVPITATGWSDENFVFLFPGRLARYIVLDPQMDGTCLLKNPQITVSGLRKLP